MRVAVLSWRDRTHPEGGGAERYAENLASGLVRRGHQVTLLCAAHGAAPREETVDGVRVLRGGGRLGVYPRALLRLRRLERLEGRFDAVVDVQNGLPFFAPLATRSPVVVLVHHVHREQWRVVFGPVVARLGWAVESRVAPVFYRSRQYVAVSGRTRTELVELGVEASRIAVIHNGTDEPLATQTPRSADPTLVVLGRLVPHKRVEQAVEVARRLRHEHPGLRLRIVGDGWWSHRVREHVRACDMQDITDQVGYVDEVAKHHLLASAWVALAPSVKEGWGLGVVEAGSHGVPTVAYHGAGGLSESIEDGRTGLLVHDLEEMTSATSRLLGDAELRSRLGDAARVHAGRFTWEGTVLSWEKLLVQVAGHQATVSSTDAGASGETGFVSRRR